MDPSRHLLRMVIAGLAVLLAGFLPWAPGGAIGWRSWLDLWGTNVPTWLALLDGLFLLCAAFLQLQKSANLSWQVYLGGAGFGALYALVCLVVQLAHSSLQIGPLLAFGAFAVIAVSALALRPKEASLARRVKRDPSTRRRLRRRKRRR